MFPHLITNDGRSFNQRVMQRACAGFQPQLFRSERAFHTLALRSLSSKLASALRVAPKAVFLNQAPLQRRVPAHRCHAIMKQRDIASFFSKPAGSAAKPPSTKGHANSGASKLSSSTAVASAKPEAAPSSVAVGAKSSGSKPEVLQKTKQALPEVHFAGRARPFTWMDECKAYHPSRNLANANIAKLWSSSPVGLFFRLKSCPEKPILSHSTHRGLLVIHHSVPDPSMPSQVHTLHRRSQQKPAEKLSRPAASDCARQRTQPLRWTPTGGRRKQMQSYWTMFCPLQRHERTKSFSNECFHLIIQSLNIMQGKSVP